MAGDAGEGIFGEAIRVGASKAGGKFASRAMTDDGVLGVGANGGGDLLSCANVGRVLGGLVEKSVNWGRGGSGGLCGL